MYSNNLNIIIIFTLIIILLSVVDEILLKHVPVVLNLSEGSVCGKSDSNFVCRRPNDCEMLPESIRADNYFDICSFDGILPIVCCPPTNDDIPNDSFVKKPAIGKIRSSNTAFQKCQEYKALNFPATSFFEIMVVGGIKAKSHEFPHMAILGYGSTTKDKYDWKCGGTLISERWILSAAHCHQFDSKVQWARLGDLNLDSTDDDALPKDYRIVKHVIHPGYNPPKRYNDIALFLLEKDAEFSLYVRPICLNTDPSLNPTEQIATGWGKTATGETTSDILLKVTLYIFPTSQCSSSSKSDKLLPQGILEDGMICAGSSNNDEDTCSGDSGGPLQTRNEDNIKTYTQFGITSFGPAFCGIKDTPAVYTKVSKYVKWIEGIVWPDS